MCRLTRENFERRAIQIRRHVFENYKGCRLSHLTLNDLDFDELLIANLVGPDRRRVRVPMQFGEFIVQADGDIPRGRVVVVIERPSEIIKRVTRLY